jgi:hypothetical protein
MKRGYLTRKSFDMVRAESTVERPRPKGRGASQNLPRNEKAKKINLTL